MRIMRICSCLGAPEVTPAPTCHGLPHPTRKVGPAEAGKVGRFSLAWAAMTRLGGIEHRTMRNAAFLVAASGGSDGPPGGGRASTGVQHAVVNRAPGSSDSSGSSQHIRLEHYPLPEEPKRTFETVCR